MIRHLFLVLIFLLTAVRISAQDYDALQLTKKIFAKEPFPDISKYITGEYKGHPNGSDFLPSITTSFLLLSQSDKYAVVNVVISDSTGHETDIYLHLVYDTVWKAKAVRALAMVGVIEKFNAELKALSPKQVAEIIALPSTNKQKILTSENEYKFMVGNTNLTLSSDNQLVEYFGNNKLQFEKLKDELLNKGGLAENLSIRSEKGTDTKKRMQSLFIDDITRGETPGTLNFLIGGILDNSVGYLYIENNNNVPKMSPGRYIMIRKIGSGWYLYKTT